MTNISFSSVSKQFGDTVAIDDLSLEIAASEFLVLLGPSGCGKSTALRMLAGLEDPTSGTISIGGTVVNDIDARHRDVAMVFQSYALYPHMTVARNIESPLVGHRSELNTKESRREQVEAVAMSLGLDDLLHRKPAQLSGGQRQRVALARAIVRRPAVFCMDEPLSNLDASLRAQTRAEIVDLHRSLDTTFVYVTHDQIEAMTMASSIAVIDGGRLQQVAEPRTIYDHPANEFVAGFIGNPAMNITPGVIVENSGGSVAVRTSGGTIPVDHRWVGLIDGQSVSVGIRPEHIAITAEGLAATVRSAEWLGHEQILHVGCGDEELAVRETDATRTTHVGAVLNLGMSADDIHLFDASTGCRLAEVGS